VDQPAIKANIGAAVIALSRLVGEAPADLDEAMAEYTTQHARAYESFKVRAATLVREMVRELKGGER
jgi:hypothetical protein